MLAENLIIKGYGSVLLKEEWLSVCWRGVVKGGTL